MIALERFVRVARFRDVALTTPSMSASSTACGADVANGNVVAYSSDEPWPAEPTDQTDWSVVR